MRKLMHELLEAPFEMRFLSAKTELIRSVDALSRAPTRLYDDLVWDPLETQFHPDNRLPSGFTRGETLMYSAPHTINEWSSEDPALDALFDAAERDPLYRQIVEAIQNIQASAGKLKEVPKTPLPWSFYMKTSRSGPVWAFSAIRPAVA